MRTRPLLLTALTALALLTGPSTGCKKKDKDTENPEAESKEKAGASTDEVMARMQGYQTEVQGEIDAVLKPFGEIDILLTDISTMPDRLGVKKKDLFGMFKASFDNGSVEVSAKLKISDEAKAEIKATMDKLVAIKAELAALPDRATAAVPKLVEIAGKATADATMLTTALTLKLKNPLLKADVKVSTQGQLTAAADLKAGIDTAVTDAKTTFSSIPAKATEAGAKIAAGFAF